jgi:hypothetical protein
MSIKQLHPLKGHNAEGGAIFVLQQKTHIFKQIIASSMESTVGSWYISLQ